jgi:hypothetical protein
MALSKSPQRRQTRQRGRQLGTSVEKSGAVLQTTLTKPGSRDGLRL